MRSEWSEFFEFICSLYSGEIFELLENTEYKSLCDEMKKNKNNKILYDELAEKKALCYYSQASLVVLRHFVHMAKDIERRP